MCEPGTPEHDAYLKEQERLAAERKKAEKSETKKSKGKEAEKKALLYT